MRVLTVLFMMGVGTLAAQTLDGDAFTAEMTSIAEKAGLPGAYKGKVGIEFANYYNTIVQKYPTDVRKINALTNRVADAFSVTFTLNGATMESAQFGTKSSGASELATSELKLSPEPIFKICEEMPVFPGCEDLSGGDYEKDKCSRSKLQVFVNTHLVYPKTAASQNVQGEVIIWFIIEVDGSISSSRITKNLGYGCDDEALRIVELMKTMGEKWIPGRHRGETVRVDYRLPITFHQ